MTFFGVSAIHEARIWNNFAYIKIFSGRINSWEIKSPPDGLF